MLPVKKLIIFFFIFSLSEAFTIERLSDDYLVSYGSKKAPVNIVQYYSFTCPHCVALFRKQFQEIKEKYVEEGKISWVFHPVPMDLLTVQAMDCLQKLSPKEKKIFLEAILEEIHIDNQDLSLIFLKKAMEVLGKPIPNLHEKAYLHETNAFLDAFQFLKSEKIEAVPSIEVNGIFIEGKVPDIAFIEQILTEKEKL